MTISVGDPFASFTYTNPIKGSHSIEVIYFAEFTDPLKNIQLHPDDHSEYQWIAETEIDQIVDNNKGVDDVEFVALRKAFKLLAGDSPAFK
jgi:hypothetical protein